MKFKYLFLLIIFLVSLTAVSAFDDNATSIVAGPLDDETPDVIEIDSEIYEDGNSVVVRIHQESTQNITVNVDNIEYVNKPLNTLNQTSPGNYYIEQKDIEPLLNRGQYTLKVKFNNTETSRTVKVLPIVKVTPLTTSLVEKDFCTFQDEIVRGAHAEIFIDNISCYKGYLSSYIYGYSISNNDIAWPSNFQYGTHKVKIIYNNTKKTYIIEQNLEYTYYLYLTATALQKAHAYPEADFTNNVRVLVKLPKDAQGSVEITLDNTTYKATPKNTKVELIIPVKDLKLGEHTVYVSYKDSKYPLRTLNSTFTVTPAIIWPSEISVGEKEEISIITPKTTNGKVNIYTNNKELLATVDVKDGYASYSLSNLKAGSYRLTVNYNIDGFNGSRIYDSDENVMHISVYKNYKSYSSSISASTIKYGEDVTVKLNAPSGKLEASLYVDDALYKTVKLSKGKVSLKINALTPGKHKISIRYGDESKFHSKTYYVTVKPIVIKLTLKKVKVKRSAKKLTIAATLKIDGKKASGKKLKFKFADMKYAAKTNRKGIAKITVSKKILKKLESGQKVTYQVSYADKTLQKTVKVKK